MSRIGLNPNQHQPNKKCFGCKYWKPVKSVNFVGDEWTVDGRCSAGYCKKYAINGRSYKNGL